MHKISFGQKISAINMLDSNGIPTGEWQFDLHSKKEIKSLLASKGIADYYPKILKVQVVFKKSINEAYFCMVDENNKRIIEAHGWLIFPYSYYSDNMRSEIKKYGAMLVVENLLKENFIYSYHVRYYPHSTQVKRINYSDISPERNYSANLECDSTFNEKGKLMSVRKNHNQIHIDSLWKYDKWYTTLEIQNDTVQTTIKYFPHRSRASR